MLIVWVSSIGPVFLVDGAHVPEDAEIALADPRSFPQVRLAGGSGRFRQGAKKLFSVGAAAARGCRARADGVLFGAYGKFRSGVDRVVAGWPGTCQSLGAEVVASLTRSFRFKRRITAALNSGENKTFAHLEYDSLLAEAAAVDYFTSMPAQCRG